MRIALLMMLALDLAAKPTGNGCYPSCYASVVFPCLGMGSCTNRATPTATGSVTRQCFSNGVKDVATYDSASKTDTVQVFLNGNLCYSYTQPIGGNPTSVTLSYRDPSGAQFATVTIDNSGTTVSCGGASVKLDPSNPACQNPYPNGPPSCVDGTCNQGEVNATGLYAEVAVPPVAASGNRMSKPA